MILGCPPRTSSDATRADLGLQLLSSRRDVAKLKWQHRLHGLSAHRLERVLYDQRLQAVVQTRGRHRRTWDQVINTIWDTLSGFGVESISLPHREFARELYSAVHDRDHALLLRVLASKPELALYGRVYEGPGLRRYLQRCTHGQQAARIRFQLRSGTSVLRHHDSRLRDQPSYDTVDRICPACGEADSIESVHHVLLHCHEYEHIRAALRDTVSDMPAAQDSPPVLIDEDGVVSLLRDDFRGGGEEAAIAADTFLHRIITYRNLLVEQFGG